MQSKLPEPWIPQGDEEESVKEGHAQDGWRLLHKKIKWEEEKTKG